ncbi:MAG: hypothetical protein RL021_1387, partial [Bacteroidota bacterium]
MRIYFRIVTSKYFFILTAAATVVCSKGYTQSVSAFGSNLRGVTEHDPWAVFCNPAGLAGCDQSGIGISQINRYSISDWNETALSLALKCYERTFVGTGVERQGFTGYGKLRLPVSAGMRLNSRFAFGIRVEIAEQRIEMDRTRNVSAAAGNLWLLSSSIRLAVWIENIEGFFISSSNNNRPPTSFITGLTIQSVDQLKGTLELETDLTGIGLRLGLEYKPATAICCRLGYATAQHSLAIGFGYRMS